MLTYCIFLFNAGLHVFQDSIKGALGPFRWVHLQNSLWHLLFYLISIFSMPTFKVSCDQIEVTEILKPKKKWVFTFNLQRISTSLVGIIHIDVTNIFSMFHEGIIYLVKQMTTNDHFVSLKALWLNRSSKQMLICGLCLRDGMLCVRWFLRCFMFFKQQIF